MKLRKSKIHFKKIKLSFPYTYKNRIKLFGETVNDIKPNTFLIKRLLTEQLKLRAIKIISENVNSINYEAISEIFKFEYSVELTIENKSNDIDIFYEINLNKLINITLIIVILIAFLSVLSVNLFLIFAGLFSVVFYILNLVIINTQISNIIKKSLGNNLYIFNEIENITAEQEKWMNDPSLCPACGEYITIFDQNCPDCGLRIKQNNTKIPVDISKYNDKKLNYHYKKKKDQ